MAPTGSDAASGTAEAPLATIGAAVARARAGEVVLVASGRYRETVTVGPAASGVTIRGVGRTRPIVDGENTRATGFASAASTLSQVVIANFEVTGQTESGFSMAGTQLRIEGNDVHHIGTHAASEANGIRVANGDGDVVSGNTIRSIGPGGEAKGVLLSNTRDTTVSGNEIRMVRKSGVRDYMGLRNVIRDNRISFCFTAIEFATSTGSSAVNNYLHDNVFGFTPKHTSDPSVLSRWNLSAPEWSRFRHNTVYRSSNAAASIAMNAPAADYIDIEDNLFAGAGATLVADAPDARGPHLILDGNRYVRMGASPRWLYHTGYDLAKDGYATIESLRESTGWEAHGSVGDAAGASLATDSTPVAPPAATVDGLDLGDSFGPQVGAAGLDAEPVAWTPQRLTPVHSTSPGTTWTTSHLGDASDGSQQTYWLTSTGANESVTFEVGGQQRFQYLVLDVFRHLDDRNVRRYRFEVSDDDEHYRTVLEGENPDASGSPFVYDLGAPVTARYLRFTLIDTFCDSYEPRSACGPYFVLSDLRAGRLDAPRSGDAAATPAPPAPSAASPASPAAAGAHGGATTGSVRAAVGFRVQGARIQRGAVGVRLACTSSTAGACAGKMTVRVSRRRSGRRVPPGRTAVARRSFSIRGDARAHTLRVRPPRAGVRPGDTIEVRLASSAARSRTTARVRVRA